MGLRGHQSATGQDNVYTEWCDISKSHGSIGVCCDGWERCLGRIGPSVVCVVGVGVLIA